MIRKALTYFILLTILLYGFRYLHYKGLLRQNRGYYAKFKTAFLEKNSFNVVFLGSSRVEMHYNTRLFDSLTGCNSFNLGMAGATPQVAFAALKAYLVNSKAPDYLFYEIDYHFLKFRSTEVKEFNNYFPFLKNDALRQHFSRIDGRINQFYYNPYFSLPYTGLKNLSTSLHGWLRIENKTDSLFYKGYLKTDSSFHKESIKAALQSKKKEPYYTYFDLTERNYLDSIIRVCRENKTDLMLVSSPIFEGGKTQLLNKREIITQLNNIARINNISYTDLSDLPFSDQRNLFIDDYHMDSRGAWEYTRIFAGLFNNKKRFKPLN